MLTRLRRAVSRTRHHDPLVADLQDAIGADRVRDDAAERALLRRDASVFDGGVAGPICFPDLDGRGAGHHAHRRAPRAGHRAAGGRHGPVGRRHPARRAGRRRRHQDEPHPRRRRRTTAWRGSSRASSTSTSPRHLRPIGLPLRPRPVEPAGRAPSAATWPTTPAGRTASPTASPTPTSSPPRWSSCDGDVLMLGGLDPEPAGLDLRGCFVGSEGTLGIATAHRRAPHARTRPRCARCCCRSPASAPRRAPSAPSSRRGIVPAAMEVMDHRITVAVENYVNAGLSRPTPPPSCSSRSTASPPASRSTPRAISEIGLAHGRHRGPPGRRRRGERALLWKGRKTAFGAIAQIAPDYYLHDTVVPAAALADVLDEVYAIAERHGAAGDERLPRRRRQPPPAARVRRSRAGDARPGARRRGRDRAGVARRRRGALGRARHRRREAGVHGRDVHGRRSRPPEPAPPGVRSRRAAPTPARCCPSGHSLRATSRRCGASPPGCGVDLEPS